jgi:Cu2+-exporting ATPase
MPPGPSSRDRPTPPSGRAAHASAGACDYCGEELDRRERIVRRLDGRDQAFCCLGCAFIAEQLARVTDECRASAAAPAAAAAPRCVQLEVRGMVCAACALWIEHRLRGVPGVASASVDFVARRALVVLDAQRAGRAELRRCIERAGYRVEEARDPERERRAERVELLRVLLAWLLMMQVMMLAAPGYLAAPGAVAPGIEQLLRIGQLVLTAPVALFCAAPFWRAAASQLRVGRIGMDVPVALGLSGALAASVGATLAASGAVYFDSVTMFVALLLTVRAWQARALARSAARADAAGDAAALRAWRLRAGAGPDAVETVAAGELLAGDLVLVPAGEIVPADGRVTEGGTSVSQAWLTGESLALARNEGDAVLAGSLNLEQSVVVRVLRAGDATSLAALQRMIVEAAARRPALAERAHRVAAHFALAVSLLAGLTALAWFFIDPARAAPAAIAVLVVTCPCALSLAAPLAFAVAQAQLGARGVLLTRPGALESLAQAGSVAFDKTGTLTCERPQLLAIETFGRDDPGACLALAAGLEARSPHPFALALRDALQARSLAARAAGPVTELAGMGVDGMAGGVRYRLGKPEFALALLRDRRAGAAALTALQSSATGSSVMLACEDGPVALLRFGETLRPGAARLLEELAAGGRELLLVSGDAAAAVERIAAELSGATGLTLERHAAQSPAGKRRLLEERQARGQRVAMVGDGINDAPVLAQADASIALASGSRLAQVRADVIVLSADLGAIAAVFELARRTTAVVRQNLGWSLAYNAVMVPLAAMGLLAPWIAAAGMAASSAVVLANSLRLRARAAH